MKKKDQLRKNVLKIALDKNGFDNIMPSFYIVHCCVWSPLGCLCWPKKDYDPEAEV